MIINMEISEECVKLHKNIVRRDKLEKQATAAITTDILAKLNLSVESLPQKCQHLLRQVADNQSSLEIDRLDSATLSLRQTREQAEKLEEEYELLKLMQKNAELQAKINRNNRFLEELRKELACSKDLLASQNPNPSNIQDYIRQLKQKVGSYDASCEIAKVKLSKLSVPECVVPASLWSLVGTLHALRLEADTLRHRADDVTLTRHARDAIRRLRK